MILIMSCTMFHKDFGTGDPMIIGVVILACGREVSPGGLLVCTAGPGLTR
jgi:hypothetical protein